MRLLVLGNPENRRVDLFSQAWVKTTGRKPEILAWSDFLGNPNVMRRRLENVDALRVESPGENWEVERLILGFGAKAEGGFPDGEHVTLDEAGSLKEEPGRIRYQQQWFAGWSCILDIMHVFIETSGVKAWSGMWELQDLFDKLACRERCVVQGVSLPQLIGSNPSGFDEVMDSMAAESSSRVFVKPRHGSSASGVVALRLRRGEIIATAAVEESSGKYFNSLRLREYRSKGEVRPLLDCICRQGVIVERWFPKCGFQGKTVDLRIVTIAGEPTHWVLRSSHGPVTNLHLGNKRGDTELFRRHLGHRWDQAVDVCRGAAAAHSGMLTLGIDLMVDPSLNRMAVAEVNAFGDLLPGIQDEWGNSTYERQVQEMLRAENRWNVHEV